MRYAVIYTKFQKPNTNTTLNPLQIENIRLSLKFEFNKVIYIIWLIIDKLALAQLDIFVATLNGIFVCFWFFNTSENQNISENVTFLLYNTTTSTFWHVLTCFICILYIGRCMSSCIILLLIYLRKNI